MTSGLLFCGELLTLIKTPSEVMADSRLYLDINIWGLPFMFFYNIATGVFSALGDSKTPFVFLEFSSTANIGVDILFVTAFGTGVMAGYSAAVKLNNMVITSFTTLGNGISNYTAQNFGAKKHDRVHQGFRAGLKLIWLLSLPLFLAYFFAGEPLLRLFMEEPSAAALHTGQMFLRILSPFYFVVSAKLVADGVLRGAGRMMQFMVATFTDLILRVVLAVLLSKTALGATGIWCAWPIGWCVATGMSLLFFRSIHRKVKG